MRLSFYVFVCGKLKFMKRSGEHFCDLESLGAAKQKWKLVLQSDYFIEVTHGNESREEPAFGGDFPPPLGENHSSRCH